MIAISRFGYLRTPLPADASPAAQADALAAALDALEISSAAVMGVSAGAPSAVQLALRHSRKVSALALVVPGQYAPPEPGTPPPTPPSPWATSTPSRSEVTRTSSARLRRRIVRCRARRRRQDREPDRPARVRAVRHTAPIIDCT
ncbi:alpha/beta fold hydrolase [Nonomuraea maheshkhaliensis]|uniref:alpha/beta fold hydrolase n=1 Tax=Nonomuraea maheshkhaliensis TaxID=419590 RepID=UPI003D159E5F